MGKRWAYEQARDGECNDRPTAAILLGSPLPLKWPLQSDLPKDLRTRDQAIPKGPSRTKMEKYPKSFFALDFQQKGGDENLNEQH